MANNENEIRYREEIQTAVEIVLGRNEFFVADERYSVGERIGMLALVTYREDRCPGHALIFDVVRILRCYFPEQSIPGVSHGKN